MQFVTCGAAVIAGGAHGQPRVPLATAVATLLVRPARRSVSGSRAGAAGAVAAAAGAVAAAAGAVAAAAGAPLSASVSRNCVESIAGNGRCIVHLIPRRGHARTQLHRATGADDIGAQGSSKFEI